MSKLQTGTGESRTASFEEFYSREFRRVVNIIYALSGSRMAAEELAQEAFVKAHHQWQHVATHPSPEAWVRRVAINLAYSSLRRRTTEARVLLQLSRERPRVEELADESLATLRAIRKLSRRQAAAVTLRYFDDLTIEQIAKVFDCEPSTVRVHLHRARSALAESLSVPDAPQKETP